MVWGSPPGGWFWVGGDCMVTVLDGRRRFLWFIDGIDEVKVSLQGCRVFKIAGGILCMAPILWYYGEK